MGICAHWWQVKWLYIRELGTIVESGVLYGEWRDGMGIRRRRRGVGVWGNHRSIQPPSDCLQKGQQWHPKNRPCRQIDAAMLCGARGGRSTMRRDKGPAGRPREWALSQRAARVIARPWRPGLWSSTRAAPLQAGWGRLPRSQSLPGPEKVKKWVVCKSGSYTSPQACLLLTLWMGLGEGGGRRHWLLKCGYWTTVSFTSPLPLILPHKSN